MPKPYPEMSQADLLDAAQRGLVTEITITDNEVITGISATRGNFRTPYKPRDKKLIDDLRSLGVSIVFEESSPGLI